MTSSSEEQARTIVTTSAASTRVLHSDRCGQCLTLQNENRKETTGCTDPEAGSNALRQDKQRLTEHDPRVPPGSVVLTSLSSPRVMACRELWLACSTKEYLEGLEAPMLQIGGHFPSISMTCCSSVYRVSSLPFQAQGATIITLGHDPLYRMPTTEHQLAGQKDPIAEVKACSFQFQAQVRILCMPPTPRKEKVNGRQQPQLDSLSLFSNVLTWRMGGALPKKPQSPAQLVAGPCPTHGSTPTFPFTVVNLYLWGWSPMPVHGQSIFEVRKILACNSVDPFRHPLDNSLLKCCQPCRQVPECIPLAVSRALAVSR